MFDRDKTMVGFHTLLGRHESVGALIRLIEEGLAPLGFNTLVLEMRYQFRCFPQYAAGTVTFEDAGRVADVCQAKGIRLVPLLPCLGHQSMGPRGKPFPLYRDHPEFLECRNVPEDAEWPDFMGHSWCASNDGVYAYIFPMIDEMAEACRADTVHVGLDEVFEIGVCPQCRDKTPEALFAGTVKKLHDHLSAKGLDMMMWGDRLLNAVEMGYSMWEADRFGTYPAIDREEDIARDIIVCDWHYEWHSAGYPSVEHLMRKGFFTVPSVWRNAENAGHFWLHALEACYLGRRGHWPGRLGGLLCTNWRMIDEESAAGILAGIRGDKTVDPQMPGFSIGDVMAQMAPKGKALRR